MHQFEKKKFFSTFQSKFAAFQAFQLRTLTHFLCGKKIPFLGCFQLMLSCGGMHQFKKNVFFSDFNQNLPYFKANSVAQAFQLPTKTHFF